MKPTEDPIGILAGLRTSKALAPSARFKKNARIRFLNRIEPMKGVAHSRSMAVAVAFRFALLGILAIALIGESLVYVAGFSAPGGILYPVKVATQKNIPSPEPTAAGSTDVSPEEASPSATPTVHPTPVTVLGDTVPAIEAPAEFPANIPLLPKLPFP